MKRKKIAILPEINNCSGDLSKKWFIYFSYRDPRNDKMQRFKVYEGLHKIKDFEERTEAAEELKQEYKSKLKNGWNPFSDCEKVIYEDQLQYNHIAQVFGKMRASNKTFRVYASKFIDIKTGEGEVEPETIATYTSKLRSFNLWLEKKNLSGNDISTLDNPVILEFFVYLINDRKLSKYTVKRYRQLISQAFDVAIQEKAIVQNPVFNIPVGKRINDQAPRLVSEFDILPFKNLISKEDPQLWLAIEFEYYCFLRPGKELRFLKVGHIDFARGTINVDTIRAKTNKERFPTIPYIFLKKLREIYQLHREPKDFYVLGKGGKPGLVHLSKNTLRNRFRIFREKLNMPAGYMFYSWKHTGNGRADDAGIDTRDLQIQNGHASLKTTELYLHHKIGKVSKEIQNDFPAL
jgi:integrase